MKARSLLWLALLSACGVPDSEGPIAWEALTQLDAETVATADARPDESQDASSGDASAAPMDADVATFDASDARHDASIDGGAPTPRTDAAAPFTLDAFEGAPAYVSKPVTESAKQRMASTGVSPTKSACLACHNGSSKAPTWLAGGTVFRDLNATKPGVDVEVRIIDMTSKQAFAAHTDADGNFYLPKPAQSSSGPYLIGVRSGTASKTMPLLQRGLDCNGSACHGGAQGPIHLP